PLIVKIGLGFHRIPRFVGFGWSVVRTFSLLPDEPRTQSKWHVEVE
ncbi:MAG: hypothetical protein ACI92S_004464, partial [Planctomycetaceae bacterium]